MVIWEQEEESDSTDKQMIEADGGGGEKWEMVCPVIELRELKLLLWVRSSTMKVEGRLEGLSILLLIDNGASYNYITKELVTSLTLSMIDTWEFVMILG